MTTSSLATETAVAKRVRVTATSLIVELRDGRSVSVPIDWYPRLADGRPSERRHWELIGPGIGIHWPSLVGSHSVVDAQRDPCTNFSGQGRIPYCGAKPGIYAIIDAVSFEPTQELAARIRLTGTFVIPAPVSSGEHMPPQRGDLYFSLIPEREAAIRKDWADLAVAAASGRVVGFAEYWVSRPMEPGDRAYEAGARGGTMNTSLVVHVHKTGNQADPEPYPLPHEHGVIMQFDRASDLNPRFGRPSAAIIADLQGAARR